MKLDPMHCPTCLEPARYTCDTIPAYAILTDPDDGGSLEYTGETEVFWDGQTSNRNAEGLIEVACRNHHRWYVRSGQ